MIRAIGRAPERGVAVEDSLDRLPGEDAGEQPKAGPGVAAVERAAGSRRASIPPERTR